MPNEHLSERDIALIAHGIGVGLSLASGVSATVGANDLAITFATASTKDPVMLKLARAHVRHSIEDTATERNYRVLIDAIVAAGEASRDA